MKLTIFTATGGIGRQLLEQAVAAISIQVRIVTADLAATDLAVPESALAGADAVLSSLGPRSAHERGISSQGTRATVQAIQAGDVRRLAVVSVAPILAVPSPGRPKPSRHDPGDGFD